MLLQLLVSFESYGWLDQQIKCLRTGLNRIEVKNRVGPNSEYGPNTEYQIIWFLKIIRIPNTKLFGFWKWMNTEYRIVLFGLNYSNTEYLKSNSSPQKNLICEFCDQMRWGKFDPLFSYLHEDFLLCFLHICWLQKILEQFSMFKK